VWKKLLRADHHLHGFFPVIDRDHQQTGLFGACRL